MGIILPCRESRRALHNISAPATQRRLLNPRQGLGPGNNYLAVQQEMH
jgi:hypothetical protein